MDRTIDALLAFLLGGMVISIGLTVFFRYVINRPFSAGDEITRLLFVWAAFLGAYAAMRRGAHVTVEALIDRLPRTLKKWVAVFTLLATATFLIVVTVFGVKLVGHVIEIDEVTPALGLPMAVGYLAIPVGAGLMAIEALAQAYHLSREGVD